MTEDPVRSDQTPDRLHRVFLIGAPRSGTSWLQAMLGAHPLVATPQELHLFTSYVLPLVRAWDTQSDLGKAGSRSIGLPTAMSREEFEDAVRGLVESVHASVLSMKPQAQILLEKTPGYTLQVDLICRFVPSPRFIHLIRDGRDVAESLMAAGQHGWGGRWSPGTTEAAARRWQQYVAAGRAAERTGHPYIEVRYEDLLAESGSRTLEKLFGFLGVSVGSEWCRATMTEYSFSNLHQRGELESLLVTGSKTHRAEPSGFFRTGRTGNWSSWDSYRRWTFNREAGKLLFALGYASADWPDVSLAQAARHRLKYRTRASVKQVLLRLKGRLGPIVQDFVDD